MGTVTSYPTPRSGSSGDMTGPASSVDGNLVVFDGTDGKTLKDGGTPTVYLGSMSWATLQASAYANGSVGLAALAADATVFVTDWRVAMVPSGDKTYWTSGNPITLANWASTAAGNDIVYTANGAAPTAVASASAGAKTRVTYGGTAHGLTAANNGVSVYVSAGSNWTVGLYPFTYVDATNIDLDVAWNASFGNPTITSVTGSGLQTTLKTVGLPAGLMQNYSALEVASTWELTSSGNNHYLTTQLGGQNMLQLSPGSVTSYHDLRIFRNRGLKTAQIGPNSALTAMGGGNTRLLTVDTSAAQTITFIGDMRTVNEFIRISGYTIRVQV